MYRVFILLILVTACSSCHHAGPKTRPWYYDGAWCTKYKIYGYPDKQKKLAQVDLYRGNTLYKSTVYYVLWPNYQWKFVSKKGYVVVDKGQLLLNDPQVLPVPDNIIYKYFDNKFKEKIDVYQNGIRVPYTLGYPDGYSSFQYLVDTPGVYTWKNGVEYFERPFTDEEWKGHERMNKALNDTLRKD
jgi:hypothetical protein